MTQQLVCVDCGAEQEPIGVQTGDTVTCDECGQEDHSVMFDPHEVLE